MAQLIAGGVLRGVKTDVTSEEALAWEFAVNIMASREVVERVEPPSLAARKEPPDVERVRQLRELESYLQRMDPTVVSDLMGHNQPSGGPLLVHFRRSCRSNEQPNPETKRDSIDLQEDSDVGNESEQAQDFRWMANVDATGSTTGETASNLTLNQATRDVARRTRAQVPASHSIPRTAPKRSENQTAPHRLPSNTAPLVPSLPAMAAFRAGR